MEDSRTGRQAAVAAGLRVVGHLGASHFPPGHAEVLRTTGAWQVMQHWNEFSRLCADAGFVANEEAVSQ